MKSMRKRISSLEIQLGQKDSDIDELRFKNKALKQTIKDKNLEINFLKVELDRYINDKKSNYYCGKRRELMVGDFDENDGFFVFFFNKKIGAEN